MKMSLIILTALISTFLIYKVVSLSFEKQQINLEISELKSIKYGLFDVNEWKQKLTDVFFDRINEYELNPENKEHLKKYIETGIYILIDEVDRFLETEQDKGNLIEQLIKTFVYSVSFNKNNFKGQVPEWADEIISIVETPETQNRIKEQLSSGLHVLFDKNPSLTNYSVRNTILDKYNFAHSETVTCLQYLETEKEGLNKKLKLFSLFLIFLTISIFCSQFIPNIGSLEKTVYPLIALCSCFFVGVLIPMISLDVRLDTFEFILIGEKIEFKNQVLYFRSKSIIQVIKILFQDGSFN